MVLTQDEARLLNHNFIGTEHILLGLIREGEGVAAQALESLGVTLEDVRNKVQETIGPPGAATGTSPPFTPRAKKVLELSLREALQLGHNYIGTEHPLLALLRGTDPRDEEGVAAQLLRQHGVTKEAGRNRVIERLAAYGREEPKPVVKTRSSHEHTPAVETIVPASEARARAAGEPIGSHHLLLAIMDEQESLGCRVLASFGVTSEALVERVAEIGVVGTSDEIAPADPYSFEAVGNQLTIRIDDAELADKVRRGELTVSFTPANGTSPPAPTDEATG
jgi:ATP-dependent Clp protease ATP-binding subunit ClpA